MSERQPFRDFLRERFAAGGFSTDDVLLAALPLLRQIAGMHEASLVAPLPGMTHVTASGGELRLEAPGLPPRLAPAALARVAPTESRALHVTGHLRRTAEADAGEVKEVDLAIGEPGSPPGRPVYLPGFTTWEAALGHHDPLTDVFVAGLVVGSMALGLDLGEPEALARFVRHRGNLFALEPRLHPVVAKAVADATELDRHARTQDAGAMARLLEGYRDQVVDLTFDLGRVKGFRERDRRGRRQVVLERLKERLFDLSRRNRVLYFRPTLQTVNLTLASVPLLFDPRTIRPEQLFTWGHDVARLGSEGKPFALHRYLRFDDAAYLESVLARILADARRDRAELGFSQLRLAICFLRWHDLKEAPQERIDSPLLLLPVELERRKGIRDAFVLTPLSTEAEVNPVLRHALDVRYGIALPESIDLAEARVEDLHAHLQKAIARSEPAVTLRLVDRPHVKLVQEKAKRRLEQYRRRLRLPGRGEGLGSMDWSYQPDDYRPLGLQLFRTRVRPARAPLAEILGRMPSRPLWAVGAGGEPAEPERTVAAFQEGGEANPYAWDFDLCSVTLGNFRYRRMSLVRDYDELLARDGPAGSLDAILSLDPKEPDPPPDDAGPLPSRYPVVPCDPTQASAIARSRTGRSYIIQGPPGTGKSQTITNLVADYAASGKRVLFVCEKRAAIDVVYHRLRQVGLHELCCLIHDSQTDKKPFVLDLKETYEGLLKDTASGKRDGRRARALGTLEKEMQALSAIDDALCAARPRSRASIVEMTRRALSLAVPAPTLDAASRELLPPYGVFVAEHEAIERLQELLEEADAVPFSGHPLRRIDPRLAAEERPVQAARERLARLQETLRSLPAALRTAGLEAAASVLPLPALARAVATGLGAELLHGIGRLDLLDPGSAAAVEAAAGRTRLQSLGQALAKAASATTHWRLKLSPDDTEAALGQARMLEGAALPFLRPAWWRLRKLLHERYDFRAHAVAPTWTSVLAALQAEHAAAAALAEALAQARAAYRTGEGAAAVEGFFQLVEALRRSLAELPAPARDLAARLRGPDGATAFQSLQAVDRALSSIEPDLALLLRGVATLPLPALAAEIDAVEAALPDLPEIFPVLEELGRLPEPMQEALRTLPLPLPALEAAVLARDVEDACRADPTAGHASEERRAGHRRRLASGWKRFLEANAAAVADVVRRRFLDHVALSSRSASQLSEVEAALKRRYAAGRKLLEHEFGKTMRYRAIRELVSSEACDVVLDLKPVWLMSPLSVSDTLPLTKDLFDVVVFDEASQVTLEEAVPALARADQVIVVGDEMQLPPTDFFSASRNEDASLLLEEEGESVAYALDSDSLLNHAARHLCSTLLGWHYRSRSECLINFSNAAFYAGKLLTVPDRDVAPPGLPAIAAEAPADAEKHVDDILARPISLHRLPRGGYLNRRNAREADYIAHLLRGLLARESGQSIGIVAFSEAQSDEIDRALERLAAQDGAFRERLEAEYEREADGQFVGLFVKNLENVQGDERDVMILSVCYGHGPDGRMLMNFGPINQSGGERRLNVVFSRARRHMAVVTSIQHDDITNTYNDGAFALRSYLQFAEATSVGATAAAAAVLRGLSGRRDDETEAADGDVVVAELGRELASRGYSCDTAVGQSHFRVPLAVRRPEDAAYRLGILVDTEEHYAQKDLLERDVARPEVLQAFGWRVAHVLTKDWYEDREAVLARLERRLAEDPGAEPAQDPDDDPADEVAAEPPAATAASPAAEHPTPAAPAKPEGARRRLELISGSSRKFYEVWLEGKNVWTRYGRIGSEGRAQWLGFTTEEAARGEMERTIRAKVRKGYREV